MSGLPAPVTRRIVAAASALVFFGFALPRLGFVISFPLMIVFTAMAGDEFRWKEAVISSLALSLFTMAAFVYGLKLQLPTWPWFIQ